MYYSMTLEQVSQVAETFASGNPVSEEVMLNDYDAFLLFDNPFEEDLDEPVVMTLSLERDVYGGDMSPSDLTHYHDTVDELVNEIQARFEDAGLSVTEAEYDESNSTDSHIDLVMTVS